MELIIDIGNTLIKYYVFQDNNILDSKKNIIENWRYSLEVIKLKYPNIKSVILSDVNGSFENDLIEVLQPLNILHCTIDLKLPFTTKYSPSKQLGSDRIALLAACCLLYPKKNRLVIDLGSCITYDILDKQNVHWGGAISPGFEMRYKGIHEYSSKLPLIKFKRSESIIGTSTISAIHSGIYNGILNELSGNIKKYNETFENLTIILTGGDAERLPKSLKNSIFAHSNFLAKGLNYTLAMNTFL